MKFDAAIALQYACEEEDEKEIEGLLAGHSSCVEASRSTALGGGTALHYCAENNKMKAMKVLLSCSIGVDPTLKDYEGNTALASAAKSGCVQALEELLLRQEWSTPELLNAQNYHGQTPLMLAMEHGRVEACKVLLQKENVRADSVADDGGTVLHSFAASDADVYDENGAGLDVVKQLTSEERGKNLIHVRNHLRETAMMCALKRGRIGACKLLLELHNDTGDNSGDEIVEEGEVLSRQQLDAVFN